MLITRNGSSPTVIRYRLIIAGLLVSFVYAYYLHNVKIAQIEKIAKSHVTACQADSESILAKLQVFFVQKTRMEQQLLQVKRSADIKLKDLLQTISSCSLETLSLKKQLEESSSKNVALPLLENTPEKTVNVTEELAQLTREVERLKIVISEKEEIINSDNRRNQDAERSLAECQKMIEQYVGAVPVAHYTQNETASFQRSHKSQDALSFNREEIEVHNPQQLLSGRELSEKLLAKKKQLEKENIIHPEDRAENDQYVQEVPNEDEKDYKEGQ